MRVTNSNGWTFSSTSMRWSFAVISALVVALLAVPPSSLLGWSGGKCPQSRPATAYAGNGMPLPSQPDSEPVSCLSSTGYATVETHIAVTNDDTVVDQPAVVRPGLLGTGFVVGAPGPHPWTPFSPAGVVVSRDQGNAWKFVAPAHQWFSATDNALYVDPWTGRIFMEMLASQSQTVELTQMLASGDDGRSWTETNLEDFVLSENARFTSTPAATYWCGNQNVGFNSPFIIDRQCFRSLEGGRTWQLRSVLFTTLVPRHPECGNHIEQFDSGDGNYPQGAADGSLYVTVQCGSVYLARSTDQAATFPILRSRGKPVTVPIPSSAVHFELRVTGNLLVLVYQVGNRLLMRTTPQASLNWSSPVTLTPATLGGIDQWTVETRDGELAVSYLAQTTGGPARNGYLTVMPNVRGPGIWTAIVNDPAHPLATSPPQNGKEDYIGAAIGPDLKAWASFYARCSADPSASTDPVCRDSVPAVEGGNDRGLVASLAVRSKGQ